MRLQKYIANQGWMSRRKAEDAIAKGWVSVNGTVVTEMGVQVDPDADLVELSKEALETIANTVTILVNKPKGVVTNLPQDDEQEVKDLLPPEYQHLSSVGRLDKDSEGLILFTDDGPLAKRLLDPNNPHEREYEVTTNIPLLPEAIRKLEEGMRLFGERTRPTHVNEIAPRRYSFVLHEGKNRQIRRIVQKVGAKVMRLKRVRFAEYVLDEAKLPPGEFIRV